MNETNKAKEFLNTLNDLGIFDADAYIQSRFPEPSPKERDSRTEADIQERLSKQEAKLARRAKRARKGTEQ